MTRYPNPEPITRASARVLTDAANEVKGQSLIWAHYRYGIHSGWPLGFARGKLDEVDQSVRLGFSGGTELIISWAMQDFDEGIDVEAGPTEAFPVPESLQKEAVVSDDGPWADLCGTVLEEVSVTWQAASQLATETAWGIRLTFAGGRRVVIALGEVERGVVRYHPTGLLVFFDDHGLQSYQNPEISQASQLWQPAG